MNQFHVVLPSSSSMDLYPDNTCAKYKVELSKPLDVNVESWEVGLAEIQYITEFHNVRRGKNNITLIDLENDNKEKHLEVPAGRYKTIEDLIYAIRKTQFVKIYFSLHYDKQRKRVLISAIPGINVMLKDSDIGFLLGYEENTVIKEKQKILSTKQPNMDLFLPKTLYIYSDIIQNQYVGNAQAPLLRVVPVKEFNSCVIYERPFMFSLNTAHLHTIEINIRDDTGALIPFVDGKVVVTLVFKRKALKFYQQ